MKRWLASEVGVATLAATIALMAVAPIARRIQAPKRNRVIGSSGHWRIHVRAFLVASLTVLTLISLSAVQQPSAGVATPMVTGPVALTTALRDPGHGYPYNATPLDLAKQGYVEEEFVIQGTANRYNTPQAETGSLIDGGHPYKTRIVVRRPKSAARFSGDAIVEWYNVSQGHDGEYDWFQSMDHLVRSGYAWVGVSNQAVGVSSLKEWSPKRYGTLDVTDGGTVMGDAMSYDIFTAAGLAIRGKANADVMGGLKVARLIAVGHSQSAGRLFTYFNSVHPLIPAVYDGVVLHGGGGRVRTDLTVKVFKLLDETDVPGQVNNRQPDTDRYRQWELAGTSHLNAQFSRAMAGIGLRVSGMNPVEGSPSIDGLTISGGAGNGAGGNGEGQANAGPNGGCEKPPFSRVPAQYALNAAFDQLARWIKDGTPPPTAPRVDVKEAPPLQPAAGRAAAGLPAEADRGRAATAGLPAGADGQRAAAAGRGGRAGGAPAAPRWEVVRDEFGNGLGGIRLSQHAVPTATNTGVNTGGQAGGERNCGLMGSYERFDAARLASLYPTHASYVTKVKEVTEKNLKAGYIVKADANLTIVEAERSDIGRSNVTKR